MNSFPETYNDPMGRFSHIDCLIDMLKKFMFTLLFSSVQGLSRFWTLLLVTEHHTSSTRQSTTIQMIRDILERPSSTLTTLLTI